MRNNDEYPDCSICNDTHLLCTTGGCEEPKDQCKCSSKEPMFAPCYSCQPDCKQCWGSHQTCEDCSEAEDACDCGGRQLPCQTCVVDADGKQVSA